ncbi:hypothetical protein K3725_21440 (plasmid) [Leisingera sp. S132]|uniref:hypothetical protein n=1 Tax=Leisingera sp. S132 TaxID=2867016 RepID=UPI0021A9302F|nr:hypothetical protein [Leisingera sp. S132]UWQ81661.1 hypothetical protein K3725_21440 [Leisingera sp. S132]
MKISFSPKIAGADLQQTGPLQTKKQQKKQPAPPSSPGVAPQPKPKSSLTSLFSEAAKVFKKETLSPEQKMAKQEVKSAKSVLTQARDRVAEQKNRLQRTENSFDKNITQLRADEKQSQAAARQAKQKFEDFTKNFKELNKPVIEELKLKKARLAQLKRNPGPNAKEIKSLEKNLGAVTNALKGQLSLQKKAMEGTIKREEQRQKTISGIISREKSNKASALVEQGLRLEDARHHKALAKGQLAIAEAEFALARLKTAKK